MEATQSRPDRQALLPSQQNRLLSAIYSQRTVHESRHPLVYHRAFASEDKVPLRNTIYTLSCVLLDRSDCDRKLAEKFKTEYGRTHNFVHKFAQVVLPEEFDLLGTVYQSFLTEASKIPPVLITRSDPLLKSCWIHWKQNQVQAFWIPAAAAERF